MKKIRSKIDQRDRVICVSVTGSHKFYFRPAASTERIYLFSTNSFSRTVFEYFRNKGKRAEGMGYSLTVRELHEFDRFENERLTRIIDRIPGMIDYVYREFLLSDYDEGEKTKNRHRSGKNEYECGFVA